MTTADPIGWLDARESPIPTALQIRMQEALRQVRATTLPDSFGEAALLCLRAALRKGNDRAGALDLLAADALLTHGAEAAAEEGADALAAFSKRYGAHGLRAALPESDR